MGQPVLGPVQATLDSAWVPQPSGVMCMDRKLCVSADAEGTDQIEVDFGDGTVQQQAVPPSAGAICHYFDQPGHFTVQVKAIGRCGASPVETLDVYVSPCQLSSASCCPANPVVWTDQRHYSALTTEGAIRRVYWDQGWTAETLAPWGPAIVRGSLVVTRNVNGAAVFEVVADSADLEPCSLVATAFGIFAVNSKGELVRTHWTGMEWESEIIPSYGGALVAGTLVEMEGERIGGLNENGELWNIWVNNGKIQFDTIPEGNGLSP